MFIVNHRPFFFWLTGALLAGAIAAIAFLGLPLSVEFTGGSLIEVRYTESRPTLAGLHEDLAPLNLGEVSLRESGEQNIVMRSRTLSPEEYTNVIAAIAPEQGTLEQLRFSSIGSSLGNELTTKAIWALVAVMLAIVLYIAWAFRKVSRPVPSWGYGITVVLMLAIDVIVPAGFYAVLCYFTAAEVDTLFIIALLSLLGYCVNDVIVIFDRIREHLAANELTGLKESFEVTIGKSITETLGRSINTSLTVVIALLALVFFGPAATVNFALVMLVGVLAGTFSSICRSAPFLIPLARWIGKKA